MNDRSFLCADCGAVGSMSQVGFYNPPDGDFHAGDKDTEPILKKNGMLYAGCPTCRSANIFFSKDYTMSVFIPPTHASHMPEGGINVPAYSIPQPIQPVVKVKSVTTSSHPAIGGGKNTNSIVEVEDVEDGDEDVGDLLNQDEAPKRSPIKDMVKSFGGRVVEGRKHQEPKVNDEPSKVDLDKIDHSKTGVGKIRQHTQRKIYSRSCRSCEGKFETKHENVLHCRKCLKGFAR